MPRAAAAPQPHRQAKGLLNRKLILDGTVALIEREGVGALSMRRLGSALGVEGMAIYHHFENREELLSAIGDRLLEPLQELELGEDSREACRRCDDSGECGVDR